MFFTRNDDLFLLHVYWSNTDLSNRQSIAMKYPPASSTGTRDSITGLETYPLNTNISGTEYGRWYSGGGVWPNIVWDTTEYSMHFNEGYVTPNGAFGNYLINEDQNDPDKRNPFCFNQKTIKQPSLSTTQALAAFTTEWSDSTFAQQLFNIIKDDINEAVLELFNELR